MLPCYLCMHRHKGNSRLTVVWHGMENVKSTKKILVTSTRNISLEFPKHEFHETCHSVTFIALVNSHQRWKQTRNRVCFHLWCELTLALGVTVSFGIFFLDNKMKQNDKFHGIHDNPAWFNDWEPWSHEMLMFVFKMMLNNIVMIQSFIVLIVVTATWIQSNIVT